MTVEELMKLIISVASLITAVTTICVFCKKVIISSLEKAMKPIRTRIEQVDTHQCKSYLVDFLADIEKRNRKR